jgi:chitin disaccharide deacetylase
VSTLAERLGHSADTKLVILSCDDLGSCHAANVGVYDAIRQGHATCASIMVPAPWARHAADIYEPTDDIGVHLTLNAEHEHYRWGPITHAPSLHSGDGGFPRDLDDLWAHADADEVYRELKAQIERAIVWGIDVTHLAPHLTAITLRPEFFGIYLELACEFRLPIRLPSTVTEEQAGFPFRKLAAEEGVLFPDHFDHDWRAGSRERVTRALLELRPGSPSSTCSRRSTRPRCERSAAPPIGGSTTTRSSPPTRAAGADRRGRRRADRLPRAQGCDASRLSAAVASPDFNSSST